MIGNDTDGGDILVMDIYQHYHEAKNNIITAGYQWEIDLVLGRTWEQAQPDHFFAEYCFVVFNAGMKNQIAQKIYEKFMATMNMELHGSTMQETADVRIKSLDVSVIGHEGKREAIRTGMLHYQEWFKELQNITPESLSKTMGMDRHIIAVTTKPTNITIKRQKISLKELQKRTKDELRTAYLETLPWIGKITKYHLARNLGIDVAKPDRHLMRLSEKFGFAGVQEMCENISKKTGDRIGLVDLILWRNANLHGST